MSRVKSNAAELELENQRLREQLALAKAREGPAQNDAGVAGRIAITRLRDADYPEFADSVARIPHIFKDQGYVAALTFIRTAIRAQIDAIVLMDPRTPDLARSLHRIHAMLSPGQAEVLMRADRAGQIARMELMEVVERYAFAPSVRAAFSRGTETPAGLLPTSFR
jgi:hypothetical protein